jgi:hypothetical protein
MLIIITVDRPERALAGTSSGSTENSYRSSGAKKEKGYGKFRSESSD